MSRYEMIIPTRRVARRGGFTLPEMVAVLSITAILAASAAPSLLSLDSTRAAAAGRQLVRDLTFARQRAIATGTRHWVVFNPSAELWSVLVENPASPGRAGAMLHEDLATGRAFVQTLSVDPYAGVSLIAAAIDGNVEVGFDWEGKPLNAGETALAGDGTVTLTGGRIVTIKAGTGYAHLP